MRKTFLDTPIRCPVYATRDSTMRTDALKLASFTHQINGQRFRFVVVKMPSTNNIAIAHKHSGRPVAFVGPLTLKSARGDYEKAGVAALVKALAIQGEIPVYKFLVEQLI